MNSQSNNLLKETALTCAQVNPHLAPAVKPGNYRAVINAFIKGTNRIIDEKGLKGREDLADFMGICLNVLNITLIKEA